MKQEQQKFSNQHYEQLLKVKKFFFKKFPIPKFEFLKKETQAEVEKLREARLRQIPIIEEITRQRDTYKVLLSQMETKKISSNPSSVPFSSISLNTPPIDYPKLLADLQVVY